MEDEASIINSLFEAGLEILHIRKPGAGVDEIRNLIETIHSKYYLRIALHQHHKIGSDYGIKRLHFPEDQRLGISEEALMQLKVYKNILSTSIHQVETYNTLSASFEYSFFGPVFNSLSKQGYRSSLKSDFIFPVMNNHPKVIAIGGVELKNIQQVKQMQFHGAAALGTIWEKPAESILRFQALRKVWK